MHKEITKVHIWHNWSDVRRPCWAVCRQCLSPWIGSLIGSQTRIATKKQNGSIHNIFTEDSPSDHHYHHTRHGQHQVSYRGFGPLIGPYREVAAMARNLQKLTIHTWCVRCCHPDLCTVGRTQEWRLSSKNLCSHGVKNVHISSLMAISLMGNVIFLHRICLHMIFVT